MWLFHRFDVSLTCDEYANIIWECLLTRPHLKCIRMRSERSSRLPFKMPYVIYLRSNLPVSMLVGSIATPIKLRRFNNF